MDKNFMRKVVFVGMILASVLYLKYILTFSSKILSFFTPLIIGGMIAFVMNVLMVIIEERGLTKIRKPSLRRGVALVLTLLIIFIFLTTLILLVIPEIKSTFIKVGEEVPGYISNIKNIIKDTTILGFPLEKLELDLESVMNKITNFIANGTEFSIKTTLGFTSSLLSVVISTLLGLVFAIYILISKENLSRQLKKLLKTVLKDQKYKQVIELSALSYKTFKDFVTGQFLEALIICVLCFLGMLIFSMPYAIAISALIGFTALIPVFGALIGTTIGAFLIVMVSPIKALWFIIFIIILQQLEGNLIYPKVIGESIGLPGIWVLAAVTIGASAYGILGMLIGVPLSSIVYRLLKQYVNNTTEQK